MNTVGATTDEPGLGRFAAQWKPCVRGIRRYGRYVLETTRLLSRGLRYYPIRGYLDIDGWLTYGEAICLYDLAKGLPMERPVIVELGSWMGKSSCILAKGVAGKRNPVLYCVDPFDASEDGETCENYAERQKRLATPLLDQFTRNMNRNDVFRFIRILRGFSFEFAESFREKIDLLFIDANHDYEAVKRDYREWGKHLKPGGIIAFHDVVEGDACPGPWRVVQEEIVNNGAWVDQKHIDSIYTATKAA